MAALQGASSQRSSRADARVADLRQRLSRGGIHGVLRELNAASGYRFSAARVFEQACVRSIAVIDRVQHGANEVVLARTEETYCRYVREDASRVVFADTLAVARLAGHPLRTHVRAYAGVPLRDGTGDVIGVLCHYDVAPRAACDDDLDLLEACALALLR